MYSVYFDNILQSQEDIININDVMETSIIRQDGFDSQEQIIREKSDVILQFTGDSYRYVRNTLKENSCHVFDVKISETSGYEYNGTMSIAGMEFDLGECIIKTDIKDSSFSAYISGYLDTKVDLYFTRTRNCQDISNILRPYVMGYNATSPIAFTTTINAFDALDCFKYIISYLTDNKFEVVSDYLIDNKYAITTGFNMHRHGNSALEIYPSITFNELFLELRKKLRLYMAIEYDVYNNAYLRIEQESYFFADVELFSIPEIPKSAILTYDNKRNFNQISIGSETYEVQDGSEITYPQIRYTAWNKEYYNKCGNCTAERESKLDLVSSYIIDTNVIFEALNWDVGDDYANDDSLFLFNYEVNGSGYNVGKLTLDTSTSKYYYNDSIKNENVLQNYIDYYQECIAVQRSSKYGFYYTESGQIINISFNVLACCNYEYQKLNKVYDNMNLVSTETITHDEGSCLGAPFPDHTSVFTVPENGNYSFLAKVVNIKQVEVDFPAYPPGIRKLDYALHIVVFQDNTFTTILDTYTDTITEVNGSDYQNLQTDTLSISLLAGNVVTTALYVSACSSPATPLVNTYFTCDLVSFELYDDDSTCISVNNNVSNLPYVLNFDSPVCFKDYNTSNLNKKGYINVAGSKQWIRELRFINKKLSGLTLMGNDLL